jgi:hypothetical protein
VFGEALCGWLFEGVPAIGVARLVASGAKCCPLRGLGRADPDLVVRAMSCESG